MKPPHTMQRALEDIIRFGSWSSAGLHGGPRGRALRSAGLATSSGPSPVSPAPPFCAPELPRLCGARCRWHVTVFAEVHCGLAVVAAAVAVVAVVAVFPRSPGLNVTLH